MAQVTNFGSGEDLGKAVFMQFAEFFQALSGAFNITFCIDFLGYVCDAVAD